MRAVHNKKKTPQKKKNPPPPPPLGFELSHLSLPALVTENTEVIDQSHQGWRRGWIPAPAQLGETLAHFFDSAVPRKRSTCWNNAVRAAPVPPSPLWACCSLAEKPRARRCDCATETFCSPSCLDPCTRRFQKGEVVGRRREDCTKQINNVMSPNRRNSTLAAVLLL